MKKPEAKAEAKSQFDHRGDEPHLLRDLYFTSRALLANLKRIVGISGSKLSILRLLAMELPQGAGTTELARRLRINAAAVSRLLKGMEEQKLVTTRPDPADGRRSHVSLTAKGKRQFTQIHERFHDFERAMQKRMSPGDIATTIAVLAELRNMFDQFELD